MCIVRSALSKAAMRSARPVLHSELTDFILKHQRDTIIPIGHLYSSSFNSANK